MSNDVRIRASLDDKVSGNLAKIRDRFDHLGKSAGFKSLVQGVGLGVGAAAFNLVGDAASAAADFIGDSVDASRDLGESLNKSKVVFGDAAADIEKFGQSAATSLGLSKQAAVEAAATFGNFFTGLGQDQKVAADMSKRLVTLAGDLASFNNLDPREALDKLRAGLAGEAEPLRRLGVFLSEAKVKAKAMEMGLGDAHGELTEGEKVLARYQLILAETTTAQGDFARTSESLANKQRQASAELINAQAELGASFEPIALQVTEWQLDFIRGMDVAGGAVDDLGRTLNGLPDIYDIFGMSGKTIETFANEQKAHLAGLSAVYKELPEDLVAATPEYRVAAINLARTLPGQLKVAGDEARQLVADAAAGITAEARKHRTGWQGAWAQYKEDLENEMTVAAQIAKLKGILASKRLAEGLKSNDPLVRASAEELQQTAIAEIQRLEGLSKKSGKESGENLADGVKSKKGAVKTASHTLVVAASRELRMNQADSWGRNAGRSWAQGLASQAYYAKLAAREYMSGARGELEFNSPAKEGPFRYIDKWGQRAGRTFADNLAAQSGYLKDKAGKFLAGAGPLSLGGSGAGVGASTSGGSMTLNLTVNAAPGMTPGAAAELGRLLMPILVKEGQKQGIFPRTASPMRG